MLAPSRRLCALLLLVLLVQPLTARAQITVLDHAQDGGRAARPDAAQDSSETPPLPAAPPPVCGTKPLTIAEMSWSSAAILAKIHARLLRAHFHCDVQLVPGDLAATGASMAGAGQPAVAPELWVTRIAEVWNSALQAQSLRPAATTYTGQVFEGWFMPDYLANGTPGLGTGAGLKAALPGVAGGARVRFITCPADWACSVINANLLAALGIAALVDVVVPSNRFDMDTLIADAVSKKQPVLFYYWQPNAILYQFSFKPIDLGSYDAEAMRCLAQASCAAPQPSSFAPDSVVVALTESVFTDMPLIAAYFQRSSLKLEEMDALLAQLNQPGATPQSVADSFVANRPEVWTNWVGKAGQ